MAERKERIVLQLDLDTKGLTEKLAGNRVEIEKTKAVIAALTQGMKDVQNVDGLKKKLEELVAASGRLKEGTPAFAKNAEAIALVQERLNAVDGKNVEHFTEQIVLQEGSLRTLKNEQRDAQRQLDNYTKLNESAEGAINQLRAQLKLGTQQWNEMSEAQREAADGQKLRTDLKQTSERLKELGGSIGDNRLKVGNYAEEFEKAFRAAGVSAIKFGGTITELQAQIDALRRVQADQIIGSKEFDESSEAITGLTASLQRARGEFDEFGDKVKKNPIQQGMNAIGDATAGVVSSLELLSLAQADNSDISELQARALKSIVVAQNIANVVKGAGNALEAIQFIRLQATTKATGALLIAKKLLGIETKAAAVATVAQTTATQGNTAAQVATATATKGTSLAFKILRGALIATGIGALVIGLIAIWQNFDKIKAAVLSVFPGLGKLGGFFTSLKNGFFGFLSGAIEGLKVVGELIVDFLTLNTTELINDARNAGARIGAAFNQGVQDSISRDAESARRKALQEEIETSQRRIQVLEASGQDAYALKLKTMKDELSLLKQGSAEEKKAYAEKQTEIESLAAAHNKEMSDKARELTKAITENQRQLNAELTKTRDEVVNAALPDDQRAIVALNQKYSDLVNKTKDGEAELLEQAKGNAEAETVIRKQTADAIVEIERTKQLELRQLLNQQFADNSEKEYKASIKATEDFYASQMQIIKQALAANTITQQEYNTAVQQLDLELINAKVNVAREYVGSAKSAIDEVAAYELQANDLRLDHYIRTNQAKIDSDRQVAEALRSVLQQSANDTNLSFKTRRDAMVRAQEEERASFAGTALEWERLLEEQRQQRHSINVEQAADLVSTFEFVGNAFFAMQQQQIQAELGQLEERKEKGLITEKQYQKELSGIRRKEAQTQKRQAIFQATIDAINAEIKVFSTIPFPASLVVAGIVAGIMGANIAAIAKTPVPQAERGRVIQSPPVMQRLGLRSMNVLSGKRHTGGGINLYDEYGNAVVNAEDGETVQVLTRGATPKLRQLMSYINESHGGIALAGPSSQFPGIAAAIPTPPSLIENVRQLESGGVLFDGGYAVRSALQTAGVDETAALIGSSMENALGKMPSPIVRVTDMQNGLDDYQVNVTDRTNH